VVADYAVIGSGHGGIMVAPLDDLTSPLWRQAEVHKGGVTGIVSVGDHLVTSGKDGFLKVIEYKTGREVCRPVKPNGNYGPLHGLVVAPWDGRQRVVIWGDTFHFLGYGLAEILEHPLDVEGPAGQDDWIEPTDVAAELSAGKSKTSGLSVFDRPNESPVLVTFEASSYPGPDDRHLPPPPRNFIISNGVVREGLLPKRRGPLATCQVGPCFVTAHSSGAVEFWNLDNSFAPGLVGEVEVGPHINAVAACGGDRLVVASSEGLAMLNVAGLVG
jgi:hypothetical protein